MSQFRTENMVCPACNKKAVIKLGLDFDVESLEGMNSFEVSQKIMENTICRGITDIQNIAKTGGDEE